MNYTGAIVSAVAATVAMGALALWPDPPPPPPIDPVVFERPCPEEIARATAEVRALGAKLAEKQISNAELVAAREALDVIQAKQAGAHPAGSHLARAGLKCYYLLAGEKAKTAQSDLSALRALSDKALLRDLCCSSPQGQPRPTTGICGCVLCGNKSDCGLAPACRPPRC